ncbi:hypothetical protein SAMD00019534_001650 [Acytostelium subglobosum LB1]|uniref:hypothetical protein n=1 Tax=Acytostelium subglobosum LB1 TaxID=1410327 RepID=UPI0006450753|nr:hypothetical protein SAMD00019534_001650 [Acytostelium subglobosum LB1]GAM16990.1 hypothetical protein SAMD00019534_001650 [Acytostelium subglobosum LB1]|eukprot:XP_012759052.1 hypothetical protein SAMD00019534_001650 [Acytostelium subglobosum LB1]
MLVGFGPGKVHLGLAWLGSAAWLTVWHGTGTALDDLEGIDLATTGHRVNESQRLHCVIWVRAMDVGPLIGGLVTRL